MSAPTSASNKRKVENDDYVPEDEDEEDESGSEWSDANSDDLTDGDDDDDQQERGHRKARREVWKSLHHPWQRLGYFLESGTRFSIIEKDAFYVVKKNPKQGPNYLLNKAKLLEENGFVWSDYRNRWQKPISDGVHDLVSFKPEDFVHKIDGQLDVFDDFA